MALVQSELQKCYIGIGSTPRLPSAYQEVEYIESSGIQYIDTGFYPTGTSQIEYEFMMLPGSGAGSFGVDSGWTTNAFSVFTDRILCYGSQYQPGQTYFTDNTKYKLVFNSNRECYLNGTLKFTYSLDSFTSSYSAYLFAKRRYNSVEMYATCRVYSLKLWNNSTLERNFVPCYRISDNVIGMYDLVNDVFYTNSGSGTFTKGADVGALPYTEITKIMKGATQIRPAGGGGWQPGANTIAYYPLTSVSTVNDMKGSGTLYNLSNNGGVTFGTNAGVDCASFAGGNNYWLGTTITTLPQGQATRTFSVWIYDTRGARIDYENITAWCGTGDWNHMVAFGQANAEANYGWRVSQYGSLGSSNDGDEYDTWLLMTVVYDGDKFIMYKNGIQQLQWSYSIDTNGTTFRIGGGATWAGTHYFKGYMSNFIIEDKARTAQEISDYYNLTKSNYGL